MFWIFSALTSHPPVPINDLAKHVKDLKENDRQKFSQEYESIEPGQQFTWDASNVEVNKPKNRYANVIAYDHSRVPLYPLEGVPGSDYINANFIDGRRKNAYIATQVGVFFVCFLFKWTVLILDFSTGSDNLDSVHVADQRYPSACVECALW